MGHAMRQITAAFLREHANDETVCGGLPPEIIVATEGYETMEDFCQRIVLPMGVEAESIVLFALPYALGIKLRIVYLDRQAPSGSSLVSIDYPTESSSGPLIHVQLRPGHYDPLYMQSGSTAG